MRILSLEPYAALSHRLFLEGLAAASAHDFQLQWLPPRKWKWRMRTASLHWSRWMAEATEDGSCPWDVLFVSDFVNLAELLALLPPHLRHLPSVIYFHENQVTYPMQETEKRDFHFALVHVHAMLVAQRVLFNSDYHRRAFLGALPEILDLVPDVDTGWIVAAIAARSEVLALGCDVPPGDPMTPAEDPVLLWIHRWEYDKNPGAFLKAMEELVRRGVGFRLRVLGESFRTVPDEFRRLQAVLGDRLESSGFIPERSAYLEAVSSADIVFSTADHEFFGLGTLEAIRCGLYPVLPDDLAYPELLPQAQRSSGRFLYPREDGIADALERAIASVRRGEHMVERRELVRHSENYLWRELGPRYDDVFAAAAASPSLPPPEGSARAGD